MLGKIAPLWRNKLVAIAAWDGHCLPANGESDHKNDCIQSSVYNISSSKGSKTTFSIIIISGALCYTSALHVINAS